MDLALAKAGAMSANPLERTTSPPVLFELPVVIHGLVSQIPETTIRVSSWSRLTEVASYIVPVENLNLVDALALGPE
jgi:hypothetical protein